MPPVSWILRPASTFQSCSAPPSTYGKGNPPFLFSCKSKLWGRPGTTTSRNSPFRLRRSPHGQQQPAGSPTQAFVSSSPSLRSSCTRQPTARCGARCYSDQSLTSSSADPASGGSRTSTCKTVGDPETAMNSPHPGAALPAPPAT